MAYALLSQKRGSGVRWFEDVVLSVRYQPKNKGATGIISTHSTETKVLRRGDTQ